MDIHTAVSAHYIYVNSRADIVLNTTLWSYSYTAVSAHYIPVNSRADIVLNMTLWSYGYTAVSAHYIPVNGRADIVLNTPYGAIVLMKKSSRGRGVLEFFFLSLCHFIFRYQYRTHARALIL